MRWKAVNYFFFTAFTAITAFLTIIHRIHRISYENLPKNLDPGLAIEDNWIWTYWKTNFRLENCSRCSKTYLPETTKHNIQQDPVNLKEAEEEKKCGTIQRYLDRTGEKNKWLLRESFSVKTSKQNFKQQSLNCHKTNWSDKKPNNLETCFCELRQAKWSFLAQWKKIKVTQK